MEYPCHPPLTWALALPCAYLGQVPEDQHIPLRGPLGHPLTLLSHIVVLLPQGRQQSWFWSEDRQVSGPREGTLIPAALTWSLLTVAGGGCGVGAGV